MNGKLREKPTLVLVVSLLSLPTLTTQKRAHQKEKEEGKYASTAASALAPLYELIPVY